MRVSAARRCTAPPERVWEWIADRHKRVRILPHGIRDAGVLENGDISCRIDAAGFNERMVVRSVETEPLRRLVERRVDGRREATTVFEIEPDGDGSRVSVTTDVALPRLVARLAEGPIRRALEQELENLDRLSVAGW